MIEVLDPGPLTSVQEASGRRGWRAVGVPEGGAADRWSALLANRLVGNTDGAALLEMTLAGAALQCDSATVVSLAGGMTMVVDGIPVPPATAWPVRARSVVRVQAGDGARAYLAVAGGVVVDSVLGSGATDLRTGFGGFEGRALRAGDRLRIAGGSGVSHRWVGRRFDGPIRMVDGPHGAATELEGTWTVGEEADRSGVRLDGSAKPARGEVPSIGLPEGSIQVPPDGRPIVMLADRPVTGGYRVPACVIRADVGRVAQLLPGDPVTLASVSMEEARSAWHQAREELAALEVLEAPRDDELGWAGSHE